STPPAQWRVLRLHSMQVDSVSSNGGPPTTSTTGAPTGGRTAQAQQPAAQAPASASSSRGRAGRSGRGGGGDDSESGGRPIDVTLVLESPNSEGIPFVTRTVGQWLQSNAERVGAPYRIAPFDPNTIVRTDAPPRSAGPAAAQGGAAAATGASAGAALLDPA